MATKKASGQGGHSDASVIEQAKSGLLEVTPADTFLDAPQVHRAEGVATVTFPSTLPGYPGWAWTISLSDVKDLEPSVLEVELMPGEGALLAPDWVPWADRLEEYLLHEKVIAIHDDPEESDDDDDHDDDFDDDVDGVDIDQLDVELDPSPLEVPDEPNDVFDHVDLDDEED